MKQKLQALFAILCCAQIPVNAQIYFQEDFEAIPVTTILNNLTGESQLPDGPPACAQGSRGNTADFNSTNVDFQNAQNASYFLGVNAEVCGGFYNATLITDTVTGLDLSAADSLKFSCRYFKSTTLGWGPTTLKIVFDNGATTFTIESEFVTTDSWDNLEVGLPASMISAAVEIIIENMGGGEGVALDDILIENVCNVIDTAVNVLSDTLTANASGLSYQWVYCDSGYAAIAGATSQNYTALTTGNYAVIITDGACSDTSSCHYVYISGIDPPPPPNGSTTIYPNPSLNTVTLKYQLPQGQNEGKLLFFDLEGRLVKELPVTDASEILLIDNSQLPAGIYHYQLVTPKGYTSMKTMVVVK